MAEADVPERSEREIENLDFRMLTRSAAEIFMEAELLATFLNKNFILRSR